MIEERAVWSYAGKISNIYKARMIIGEPSCKCSKEHPLFLIGLIPIGHGPNSLWLRLEDIVSPLVFYAQVYREDEEGQVFDDEAWLPTSDEFFFEAMIRVEGQEDKWVRSTESFSQEGLWHEFSLVIGDVTSGLVSVIARLESYHPLGKVAICCEPYIQK